MLSNKNILLCITGSIAAYKSAFLTRLLIKQGASVKVVMTPFAKKFITPLTLSTLSKNPVYSDFIANAQGEWNNHVDMAQWADYILIAPATADVIAKMATGICDNLLLAVYLSAKSPVVVAPAMDLDMYKHPTTKENLKKLRSFGNLIIPPGTGELASGLEGEGRMAEPEEIIRFLSEHVKKNSPLIGKKALVTAGPTYEAIDPVRFIGNHSSGKMGIAIAEELAKNGAEVTLVCGPTQLKVNHAAVKRIDVTSAEEMHRACMKHSKHADAIVMAAAVADFKAKAKAKEKIKKEEDKFGSIELVPTKDILSDIGKHKNGSMLVGFALETENGIANAKKKLYNKNLDLIVLNAPGSETGFGHDTNKITIIEKGNKGGKVKEFGLMSKLECAKVITKEIIRNIK